ncbi:NUDIX domain-containing protein [Ruminococcaceae bacterium OttesenSCG-928-D13]|nr:NUDIX domain-containing protein [Ruminococcaceae bacterium OttesenSCG-928-D13]
MLIGTTSPLGSRKDYLFVAVMSRFEGQLLLSRHAERQTWETQGGHIEPGETPLAAAKRELYEESGAVDFAITPVCDYSAAGTHGIFFFAEIARLGPLPESEMAETRRFAALPPAAELTYPGITPVLFEKVRDRFDI